MALICVLILMVLLPVMAASGERSSWSAGINLGTGVQSSAQYRIKDDLDIVFGVGYDFFTHALYGDIFANFLIGGFNIEKEKFDITVGGGLLMGIYNEQFELSVVAPVGITYSFLDDAIPLDLYIRVGPSIRIFKGYQVNVLSLYSYVGAMYRF